ncbi:MAG: winged helix-turn-helix transcriptional regulator [Desulfobacteraceae bacterium]|jgi:DNA-binding MarR family transcriptional regulator|nr:winged helix-turn-helix transcriptional regulator [Desulfobacteraceae bacterium]
MTQKPKALDHTEAVKMGKSCVCFITRKAARCITQFYDEMLRPTGIRSTQLTLLTTIKILGPVSVKRMAEVVVMDRSTLARNLKPLDRQGLIRIEPGEDLRERIVSLTPPGLEKWKEAYSIWGQAQTQIKDRLGQEGLDTLFANLSELVSLTRNR